MSKKEKPSWIKEAVKYIKKEEGFRPYVYDDHKDAKARRLSRKDIETGNYKGFPTIGHGRKLSEEELKSGKVDGKSIYDGKYDEEESIKDIEKRPAFKSAVKTLEDRGVGLSDKEKIAYTSFGYNLGGKGKFGPKKVSALNRVLNVIEEKGLEAGLDKLQEFRKSGKAVVPGLIDRRRREAALIREGYEPRKENLLNKGRSQFGSPEALEQIRMNNELERKKKQLEGRAIASVPEGESVKNAVIESSVQGTSQVKTALKNEQLGEHVEKAEIKREKGEQPSPKEQFLSGLALFLPTAIAGIAGAVAEGSAGLAAGIEGGFKGTQATLNMAKTIHDIETKGKPTEMQEERLALSKKRQALEQERLDLTKEQEKRRIRQLEEVGIKGQRLKERQASQVSGEQVKQGLGLDKTLRSIGRIRSLKKGVNTGWFADKAYRAAKVSGVASPRAVKLDTELTDVVAAYIRSISGAQASEKEVARLERVVPQFTDDDAVFDAKLQQFDKIIRENRKALEKAIRTGQPLSAEAARKLTSGIDELERLHEANSSKPANKSDQNLKTFMKNNPQISEERAIEFLKSKGLY